MEKKSLHAFIKEEILTRIKSGHFQVGEKIPTELELCTSFNVSRTTVRTALNQLTQEGYLLRHQGRGTYVADPKVKQTLSQTIKRYSDQVAGQGKKPKISLLDIQVIPASEVLSQSLDLSRNEAVQRIERIRLADQEAIQYEVSYIPWSVAPGLTKEHAETSLYAALQDVFDVHIAKTTEQVEITFADQLICNHLQCEAELPLFYIETTAENKLGKKIEFSRSYFRGDKTNFVIERLYE
ncbi:GntR family transcriptional regulator [Virgibacillus senegalensis]|uniref:GntR family transcriptional regulator n=1 Tax=Virgibacillus senegalensis TaxID=1499679 RepID=UPI00069F975C|nr:GntR family transcriptional regulator [Virgibacillus senegalensis]